MANFYIGSLSEFEETQSGSYIIEVQQEDNESDVSDLEETLYRWNISTAICVFLVIFALILLLWDW